MNPYGGEKQMNGLMDFLKAKDKNTVIYLCMLLALGALLLMMGKGIMRGSAEAGDLNPPGLTAEAKAPPPQETELHTLTALEARLEEAFALMDGVGKVRVLLSATPETAREYATDANITESVTRETDAQGGSRETHSKSSAEKTIILTDKTGTDQPLILRETAARIAGAVIIAEGGDNVFVKDALTKAACTVLSLEANRVQVLKMK